MKTPTELSVHEQLEQLLSLEALRNLRGRYWRYVDTKQWSAFGRLFSEDASFVDHSSDFACHGREEIESGISGVLGEVLSVHLGQQSELELLDANHARGIWALQDHLTFPSTSRHPTISMPVAAIHGAGFYVDRYVRDDGEWLFESVDLYRLDTQTVISGGSPSIPDFTVGHDV